jgi:hypothetical protein
MWTKRMCGLSPEALSHMASNSVGCDCPSSVPTSRKNLRWYASGVAGKMKASSHPILEKETTRFREVVGMDYLEFKVNGTRFHGQGFIDFHTTSAEMYVHRHRSQSHEGLLRYLNSTEEFVEPGYNTLVKCVHDNAKEFLKRKFK